MYHADFYNNRIRNILLYLRFILSNHDVCIWHIHPKINLYDYNVLQNTLLFACIVDGTVTEQDKDPFDVAVTAIIYCD
jgi:hypothetical protein